uniref:Putative disease resistance protein At3g14460 n=1 Tax=Anthurium amnicola TaxID=1678845 RepID=A0A1D1YP61_9ARAE
MPFKPSGYGGYFYVMDDLIHDLAEYVSRNDCFRLEDMKSMQTPDTVCHISLHITEFSTATLNELCRHEKLQTLLFLHRCEFGDLIHALDELFLMLKRLHTLRLSECGIMELLSSIGGLKHLWYLDLSENPLESLPESRGNLYNLQVLELSDCRRLGVLPTHLTSLAKLKHLEADRGLVCSIDGLEKLTALL